MRSKTIAVVGSGISGLSAAWLLSQKHDVTLFEQDGRFGGHSNTVTVPGSRGPVPVDTGFIVFNVAAYPNLVALFSHLGVSTYETNMGFAVSMDGGRYEYSGDGLAGLFGQSANLLSIQHWGMIRDLVRFFNEARVLLDAGVPSELTLGEFLERNGYSRWFQERHILPMAAAIWSAPTAEILAFPAASFFHFFANHQLLQLTNRPLWRTVDGGSRAYVSKLLQAYKGRAIQNSKVERIARSRAGVDVYAGGSKASFDACVLACHADQALHLLGDADGLERQVLGAFRYSKNTAVLHSDISLMPQRRRLWSSWNYMASTMDSRQDLFVTYWMNKLQKLDTDQPYFVSLNPATAPKSSVGSFEYEHPVFDGAANAARARLWELQGRRNTWFCGSYFGFGFHEDGIQSGLAAAEDFGGVRRPWSVENESGRIFIRPRKIVSAEAA